MATRQSYSVQTSGPFLDRHMSLSNCRPSVVVRNDVERLGDLVDAAVDFGNRIG